jgi:hypothetical protein
MTNKTVPITTNDMEKLLAENEQLRHHVRTLQAEHAALQAEHATLQTEHAALQQEKATWQQTQTAETGYRLLAEHTNSFILRYRIAPPPGFEYISPSITRIMGYHPEEYYADPDLHWKTVHPNDYPILKTIEDTNPFQTEPFTLRYITRQGEVVWIELRSSFIFDENDQAVAVESIGRDVTSQQELLEQLHASRAQLQAIFDNAAVGIVISDRAGNYHFVNRHATETIGYSQQEIYQLQLTQLVHPDDLEALFFERQHLFDGSISTYRCERRYLHKDGSIIWVDVAARPLYNQQGEIDTLLAVLVDITDRKTMEENIHQINAELEQRVVQRTADIQQANLELQQANERLAYYAYLVESVSDAIISTDTDLRIKSWNRAAQRLYGWQADEVLGKHVTSILQTIFPEDSAMTWQQEYWSGEVQQRHKDGSLLVVQMSVSALRNPANEYIGIVAIKRDITAQKHAEEQVRFQSYLLSAIGQAVIATTLDGTIIYWNQAAEKLYGWSQEEAIGQTTLSLLTGSSEAIVEQGCEIMQQLNQGEAWSGEFYVTHRDGERFPVLVTDVPFHDKDGNLTGIIGVSTDITERKKAEQDLQRAYVQLQETNDLLQRSRDLLRIIFDTIEDSLVLLDRHGIVLAANQPAARLMERPLEAILQQPWESLCHLPPLHGEQVLQSEQSPAPHRIFPCLWILDTLQGGSQYERCEQFITRDGVVCMLDIKALPVFQQRESDDRPAVIEQMVLHMADITERMQLESLLVENERLATIQQLAQIVAHEVNSPLQVVMNALEIIEGEDQQTSAEFLRVALNEIERIGRIVHQLKDIQKLPDTTKTPVDINRLIEQVLLLLSGKLASNNIRVECLLANNLPLICAKAGDLHQVLLNIIMNASEAMEAKNGGILRVRTAMSGGYFFSAETLNVHKQRFDTPIPSYLMIEIVDTGIGILQSLQEQVFAMAFTTKTQGMGVGLFISRKIIAQHGGEIHLTSQPGSGTTVTIKLPYEGTQV